VPEALINNPRGAFGQPVVSNTGLNQQKLIEVVNNSGGHLQHGDVVVWDTNTALVSAQTTTTGSQSLPVTATSQTVTASAGFTFPSIVVANQVTPTGFTSPINLVGLATAAADGTHLTIAWARVGGAGTLPAGTTITQIPSSVLPTQPAQLVGMPAAPSDAGRSVTATTVAAGNDPLIAGVVSVTGDAATNASLIAPGSPCFICVEGIARVQIAGLTVAAGGILTTAAAQPTCAKDVPGTLGNVLGIALEANGAKDANNTIRAAIKLG
jgi:hypothetical protein